MIVDGEAGTPMTEWDGNPASLDWVSYDVTALPYHLRKGGTVAVVGVGGGRDVLAAIWSGEPAITGIEINGNVLALLTRYHRRFTRLADHPGVQLVHDEGRAYLTRTRDRFDVIQMSLVDTWAATGAGAFTLSENSLYTIDAWRMFLDRLAPTGVLSVSRWFSPVRASETSRLLALAVRALLDRGVGSPQRTWRSCHARPWRRCWCRPTRCRPADLARRGSHQPGPRVHGAGVAPDGPRPMRGSRRSSAAERSPSWRRPLPIRSTTTRRPPTRGRSSSTW